MRKRLLGGGSAAAVLIATSLAMGMAPAMADPSTTPDANDIVGVGSDTSQFALDYLADGHGGTAGYNSTSPSARLASFDATDSTGATGGSITLRSGASAITRPNGSGAGIALLYGAGNDDNVSYARSSSAIDTTATSAGLQMFPFALDTLKTAVAPNSHAPAALTRAQLLGIYKGTYTNWNQVGGTSGVIKPYVPQASSGTGKFFLAQLTAENGGTAPTYAPSVTTTQEHSDTDIKNNPDAIAPFSAGRAQLLGTVRLEGGFFANRALYNVVRGTGAFNVSNTDIQSIFGSGGFVCSTAAAPLISAAGFTQLASSTSGGVCGVPTQTATSNFKTSGTATTHTSLTASQPTGTSVRLTAAVSGGFAPAGSVEFFEGSTSLGSVALSGGQASVDVPSASLGSHSYTANFTPSDSSAYTASSDAGSFVVRQATTTAVSVSPAAATYGRARTATVHVTSTTGTPTGVVTITLGGFSVTKVLSGGVATAALPATTPPGTRVVGASYAGDSTYNSGTITRAFAVRKASVSLSESFPAKVKKRKHATGSIKVVASGFVPGGTFSVTKGSKTLVHSTLSRGSKTVTLPKLGKKGRKTLVVHYSGSSLTVAKTLVFTIKQK